MSIFKKSTYFPQLLADLITYQFDFLGQSFDRLMAMADEFNALEKRDQEEILDKAHELIIVDILIRCGHCFSRNVSNEAVGQTVRVVYAKYLTEYRNVAEPQAEQKLERVMTLYDLVHKAERETDARSACNKRIECASFPGLPRGLDAQQFYICRGFAEYCAGEHVKAENWEGRHFAAFKLAQGLVGGDVVGNALKHYRVTF